MINNTRFKILICVVIMAISAVLAPFGVSAALGEADSGGISEALTPKSVTMAINEADVRDVLSAIAVNMGNNIVYTGPATTVTLDIDNLSPVAAFEYLLKSLNLTYLQEGNTLIVGDRDTLQNNFSRSLALTRFDLRYITPDVLTGMISRLNLPVTVLMLNANERSLWIQGFPMDIAKVRELITAVDIEENSDIVDIDAPEEVKQIKTLSSIKLSNISPYEFKLLLQTLGIDYSVAVTDDEDRLYIYATPEERQTVLSIRSRVDRRNTMLDVEGGNKYEILNADKVAKQTAISAIAAVCPGLTIISVDNASTAFLVRGSEYDIDRARELLRKLNEATKEVDTTFFFYDFENITAAEAERRLEGIKFGDEVEIYLTTLPDFSATVFVYCNSDYQARVRKVLDEIDQEREKLATKALPVFRASSAAAASEGIAYLDVMLGLSSDEVKILSLSNLDMWICYVDAGTSIEKIELMTLLIDRLYSITSDGKNINISEISFKTWWDRTGQSGNIDNPTDAQYQDYGRWVYNELRRISPTALSASELSDDWDDQVDVEFNNGIMQSDNTVSPVRSAPSDNTSAPPVISTAPTDDSSTQADDPTQTEGLDQQIYDSACGALDALFNQGGMTVTSDTKVSDVYKAAENAISGISGASVAYDPDKPEKYVQPTKASTGSLSVSIILRAGGYERSYDVDLELPAIPVSAPPSGLDQDDS